MIYLLLAFEFFKTGLFSFGGGYATIPFLYHISEVYGWYSPAELTQMTAIASITPGAVGINVATYAGLKTTGIIGSMTATVSEILPSFFLVIIVSKLLKNFSENLYVKALILSLKPISCALLLSVGINLLKNEIHNFYSVTLLAILFLLSWKRKRDPLFYMLISASAGLVLKLLHIF